MDNTAKNNKNGNVKWIVALCLTAVLAVIGWTTTANLAARMTMLEEIKTQQSLLNTAVTKCDVRISVLETRWVAIQSDLTDIRLIVQKIRDDR